MCDLCHTLQPLPMTMIGVVVSGGDVRSEAAASDAAFVARALEPLGEVVSIPAAGNLREVLGAVGPNIVFHATDVAATAADRVRVTSILEECGLPFTGSDWQAIALTSSRQQWKDRLRTAEVATAAYTLVASAGDMEPLTRRSFPLAIFASRPEGPPAEYVVADTAADLERLAAALRDAHSAPVLVERHLQGVTLCCVVLGNGRRIVLPPISLPSLATPSPDGRPWVHPLPDGLLQGVERVALAACDALGLRDLSRIDVALSDAGVPHVVAVYALPSLAPGDANPVSLAAQAAQLEGGDLVLHCLVAAAERTGVAIRPWPGLHEVRRKTPPRGLRRRRA